MALPIPAIPHASHPLFHFQIVREREADKVHGCFRNEIIGPGGQSPKHRRDDGSDEKRKAALNDGFVAHWWSSFAFGRPRGAHRALYGKFLPAYFSNTPGPAPWAASFPPAPPPAVCMPSQTMKRPQQSDT